MEHLGHHLETPLVDLGGIPLADLLTLDEEDSVLATSIRRVINATQRSPQETRAAFNNYI